MENLAEKTCKKCGICKPIDSFRILENNPRWRGGECKECRSSRQKAWAKASKDKVIESRRRYQEKNREKIIARVNDWVANNPEKRRKNALAYYYRLQDQAIMAYGGYECVWCGIDEPLVLCLDHVENNGNAHRKEVGAVGGHKFYKWLKDNEYPPGFQVLCMNCNHAKYRNGGVLPDQLKGRCNDYPARE